MKIRDILIGFAVKYKGDWEKIYQAIKNREHFANSKELAEYVLTIKSNVITIFDPEYPQSLKQSSKPPYVLFYYGDISLVNDEKRCVSYIGSRDSSLYGEKMANILAGEIAKNGYVVVSGMAKGIDAIATEAALDEGDGAVAVLGSGIDVPYPSSNNNLYKRLKKEGLIISEYPGDTPPKKEHFPERNRIIAALSRATIVGEASKRSGTLITVGYALDMGRDVACVPYRMDEDSACNTLIKEGALILTSVSDVCDLLPPI